MIQSSLPLGSDGMRIGSEGMIIRRQSLYFVAVAVLGVAAAVAFSSSSRQRPVGKHHVDAQLQINSPKIVSFIQSRVASIIDTQLEGTTATYDIPFGKPRIQSLTLSSETMLTLPDHHGFGQLALVSIVNDRATIAYLLQTDLRSFGDDTTSVQTGVVTIDVVKRKQ